MKKAIRKTLALAMTAATILAVPAASISVFATENADSVQATDSESYT